MMFHWYHFLELVDRFLEVQPRNNAIEIIFFLREKKRPFDLMNDVHWLQVDLNYYLLMNYLVYQN
jgi:hypothetical protein